MCYAIRTRVVYEERANYKSFFLFAFATRWKGSSSSHHSKQKDTEAKAYISQFSVDRVPIWLYPISVLGVASTHTNESHRPKYDGRSSVVGDRKTLLVIV